MVKHLKTEGRETFTELLQTILMVHKFSYSVGVGQATYDKRETTQTMN